MTTVPSPPTFSHFEALPPVPDRRVAVRLTKDALRQVRGGHPWVYDQAINSIKPDSAPTGSLGVVFDDNRRFVAIGLYDPDSPIVVRILHQGAPTPIDASFWLSKVTEAAEKRSSLIARSDVTGLRHIHGENDGLGGLIVDEFSGTFVVKIYTAAWLPHIESVLRALVAVHEPERIVIRLSRTVSRLPDGERANLVDGMVVYGPPIEGSISFLENGLVFSADVISGQKTGHFLDQRDNRAFVAEYAQGKRILDVFSCTGGFAVHAAASGAESVHVVDRSPFAIEAARHHFDQNVDSAKTRFASSVGDAFEVLADLVNSGERFDLVVVDPPAFASRASERTAALRSYRALAELALDLLVPGGRLFQASCSTRVTVEDLVDIVERAASERNLTLSAVRTFGHAVDHPVSFTQGRYLDAVTATVHS